MAFEEAKSSSAINLTEYRDKPLEAYYLGKREIKTDDKINTLHQFEKSDGTLLEVWGFDLMNRCLMNVPKGCLTKITYTGTTENKEKNKKQHICTVYFDKEKTIDTENKIDDLPF